MSPCPPPRAFLPALPAFYRFNTDYLFSSSSSSSTPENREIHQTIPDHRVKLTDEGHLQAREAGRQLRKLLRPDDTLHFFTSPYRRTRQTTEGMLETLCEPGNDADDDDDNNGGGGPRLPSFRRQDITVHEEPRLREQDFGNFQPCSAEMERMWQERADYGHFFYRIPNGESAADAYDRVSGFNESLWRQFGEDDFASVCVLVTHGLMSRVFLMKWYHFTVEYFEDLRNVNHCEFLVMRQQENGKYLLQNKLRTWSDLRREKALKDKDREKEKDKDKNKEFKLDRTKTFISTRRWGGCPNGCNHKSHYKRRDDLEFLRQKDLANGTTMVTTTTTTTKTVPRAKRPPRNSSDEDELDGEDADSEGTFDIGHASPGAQVVRRTVEETVHRRNSSGGSGPVILMPAHLHVGRDFGGTYSGHASTAGSDTEASEDDANRHVHGHGKRQSGSSLVNAAMVNGALAEMQKMQLDGSGGGGGEATGGAATCLNRLGDAPLCAKKGPGAADEKGEGGEEEEEDLDKAEKEDRSIRGSVY